MKHHHDSEHSDTLPAPDVTLLNALSDCIAACNHCLASCLREEDVQPMVTCIALDQDCAAACQLAHTFVSTQSLLADDALKLCAEACARCAAECQKHPMEHCTECEAACITCEQACRDHLKHEKHF